MLSEVVASMPGLTKGFARTFRDDIGLSTGVSPLGGSCEPPPRDSLLELLPGCENEPLAMLCIPDRSAAEVPPADIPGVSDSALHGVPQEQKRTNEWQHQPAWSQILGSLHRIHRERTLLYLGAVIGQREASVSPSFPCSTCLQVSCCPRARFPCTTEPPAYVRTMAFMQSCSPLASVKAPQGLQAILLLSVSLFCYKRCVSGEGVLLTRRAIMLSLEG